MRMFIEGPIDQNGTSKIVNLKNVTNIAFEEFYNRDAQLCYKIIYNYNYGVSLKQDYSKIISDYTYMVFDDREIYDGYVDILNGLITEKGWIAPIINGNVNRITNPESISFLATDPRKNRVILNLGTSVSFYSNNMRKTSDFIYLDFSTPDEFKENLEYIKGQLDKEF